MGYFWEKNILKEKTYSKTFNLHLHNKYCIHIHACTIVQTWLPKFWKQMLALIYCKHLPIIFLSKYNIYIYINVIIRNWFCWYH